MRHGWLLALVLCVLTGCAKEADKKSGWASFPVAIYADPAVVASNQDESDLMAAFSYWEAQAGRRLFDYKGQWTGATPFIGSANQPTQILANVILFQNPWPFAGNTAGQTTVISSSSGIEASVVMLNENIGRCSGDCAGETSRISQQKLIAHELGHFLGLSHSSDPSDIMYPSLGPGGTLSQVKSNQSALRQVTSN